MEIGDKVLFVPSHDGEYNGQPGTGVVQAIEGPKVHIVSDQESFSKRIYRVDKEYVVDLDDPEAIVRLVLLVNDMLLDMQRRLYLCEIHLDFDQKPWLYQQIRAPKYHIN